MTIDREKLRNRLKGMSNKDMTKSLMWDLLDELDAKDAEIERLKGRDARPVVVPIKDNDPGISWNIIFTHICTCGHPLNDSDKHCPDCGAPLDWSKADD